MRYRLLGRTGAKVSQFAIGGMVFGWKTPEEEAVKILDRAIDRGVNIVDTSNSYGRGRSEEIIGNWAASRGSRNRPMVATKFHLWADGDPYEFESRPGDHVVHQCEESLRRLRVDTIDLFQLHRSGSESVVPAVLHALDSLVRAGKIRWAGASTRFESEIRRDHNFSVDLGTVGFDCEQTPYNLLDRRAENEVFPVTQELGLGVLAWSPLAEGVLTCKYRRNESLPAESRYARVTKPGLYRERLTEPVFKGLDGLRTLAERRGVTPSEAALAWCAKNAAVSSVIIGPSSVEQLEINLRALDFEFAENELNLLDEIFPPADYLSPYFPA